MSGQNKVAFLKDMLVEQGRSMGAMAAMFIGTILLAIYIQPYWDRPEARAFGEAGTTKVGLIGLEFILIIIFTALIIWLAKRGLQWIIKWGVLFILWISLAYAMVPLASYAMDVPDSTLEFRAESGDGEMVLVDEVPNTFVVNNGTDLTKYADAGGLSSGIAAQEMWTWSLDMDGNGTYSAYPSSIVTVGDDYVYCDGVRWVRIDGQSGEIETERNMLEESGDGCLVGFENDVGQWAINNRLLYKTDPFRAHQADHGWVWMLPNESSSGDYLYGRLLSEDKFLLVAEFWAGIIELPDQRHGGEFGDVSATLAWEVEPVEGDNFTSTTWGHSPWNSVVWWDDNATDRVLLIGSHAGQLNGYVWDGENMLEEEHIKFNERGAFDGPIRGLMLGDDWRDGRVDVWVIDDDRLKMFSGWSMVESMEVAAPEGNSRVGMALHTVTNEVWSEVGFEDGVVMTISENKWQSGIAATPANEPAFIIQDASGYLPIHWSSIVAMVAATALMILMTLYPEWYVVNTTGVLTGAGVITIIGVSFVPSLIMIFMVVTAIYDAYAVYKSKHMLDLADTMIGLKLPILLVAPQDKGYSFREEGDSPMREPLPAAPPAGDSAPQDRPPPPPRKGGQDALFMGLGDVIFPGMLVISALTFIPSGGALFGLSAPLFVAIGTLVGGFVGYCVLMTYVAMGRPQAGLPLLNGGSILGYLVAGLLAVGTSALSFGITLL